MEFNSLVHPFPCLHIHLLHKLIKMFFILIIERRQHNCAANESADSSDNE